MKIYIPLSWALTLEMALCVRNDPGLVYIFTLRYGLRFFMISHSNCWCSAEQDVHRPPSHTRRRVAPGLSFRGMFVSRS